MARGWTTSESSVGWLLAALLVGSLLAFDPAGWAVFGPLKWTIVLTLGLAAVAVAECPLTFNRPFIVGWGLFLAWGVVVSFVAVDPLHTWVGTPDRHLGLLAWLVFAFLFVLGQSIETESSVRLLLRASVVALLGIGLYTTLEWLGAPPVDLNLGTDRFAGPLGSPAYLGAALALLLPVAAGAAADGLGSRAWRAAAAVSVAFGIIALVGSQTRAAWLGVIVAGVFAVPALLGWLRRTRWIPLVAIAVVAMAVILSPAGGRLRDVVDFDDAGTRGRIDEWQVAVALVGDRPITGAGFEGHRIVFPEQVDADYEQRYGRQVTPDRAHNGALDMAVTTGIPGLLLYLAGATLLIRRSWIAVGTRQPWLIGLAAGIVAYIAQQQILFPLAEVDPAFWILAGMLVTATGAGRSFTVHPANVVRLGAAVLAGVLMVTGVLDVMADRSARTALDADDLAAADSAATHATTLRPDSIRYWVVAAAVVADSGGPEEYRIAIDRIDQALRVSPDDPILRSRKAEYLLEMARVSGDDNAVAVAVGAWAGLVEYDPNNARYQLQYGVAAALARDAVTAEAAWLQAEWLAPRSAAAPANLAVLYLAGGHIDAASDAVNRGLAIEPESSALLDIARQLEAATNP